jgi:Co/Zn/Cd efflux system component
VRHLTEIVNSNADLALGHNATDPEETDEMVPPKIDKLPNNKQTPCRAKNNDPGHMNMKGVFLHVLSDALGK